MTDLEIASIQTSCLLLISRYAHAADGRDDEKFVQTFAPSGEWVRLDGKHIMRGRDEIRQWLKTNRGPGISRHVSGSADIEVLDAGRAKGLSYTVVYRDADWKLGDGLANFTRLPDALVDYRDDFTLIDGRWYFARREARYVYAAAGSVIPRPR